MIHSSRRDRKTKAIAEALAMFADAHPELVPHRPRPVHETDEWLWESATEFCAALDRYAGRSTETERAFAPGARRQRAHGETHPKTGLDLRAAPPRRICQAHSAPPLLIS